MSSHFWANSSYWAALTRHVIFYFLLFVQKWIYLIGARLLEHLGLIDWWASSTTPLSIHFYDCCIYWPLLIWTSLWNRQPQKDRFFGAVNACLVLFSVFTVKIFVYDTNQLMFNRKFLWLCPQYVWIIPKYEYTERWRSKLNPTVSFTH